MQKQSVFKSPSQCLALCLLLLQNNHKFHHNQWNHGIVLGLQTKYISVPLHPFGNCVDISYLKEQFKLYLIRNVCILLARA